MTPSVMEAIGICLDHGIDINATNDAGETAVYAAIGAPELIRFLAEHGARLDVKNNQAAKRLSKPPSKRPSPMSRRSWCYGD